MRVPLVNLFDGRARNNLTACTRTERSLLCALVCLYFVFRNDLDEELYVRFLYETLQCFSSQEYRLQYLLDCHVCGIVLSPSERKSRPSDFKILIWAKVMWENVEISKIWQKHFVIECYWPYYHTAVVIVVYEGWPQYVQYQVVVCDASFEFLNSQGFSRVMTRPAGRVGSGLVTTF